VVPERLKEGNAERRWQALYALGNMGSMAWKGLAEVVKAFHKDEEPENRAEGADCLARLAGVPREKIPDLIEALKDKAPQVRRKAAEALRRMGPLAKPAEDALRELQKSGRIGPFPRHTNSSRTAFGGRILDWLPARGRCPGLDGPLAVGPCQVGHSERLITTGPLLEQRRGPGISRNDS
jgi:HEAT repeats